MGYRNFVEHAKTELEKHPKFGRLVVGVTPRHGVDYMHTIKFKEGTKLKEVTAVRKFVAGLLSPTGLKASRNTKSEPTWGVLVKREGNEVHLQAVPNATLAQSSRAKVLRLWNKGKKTKATGAGL